MFGESKNRRLLIIGASGHGKVVADIAEKMACYDEIMYADADESIKECMGYQVVLEEELTEQHYTQYDIIVAVGNSKTRRKITTRLEELGCFVPTLVHPNAVVAKTALVEEGTVIMAGAIINPDARIGKSCIINTSSSVDHDCIIGDFCHVSVGAHLAGTVTVGEHTWIGAGACVNNNLDICPDCMIGSGAMVVNSITEPGVYVGVPAMLKIS